MTDDLCICYIACIMKYQIDPNTVKVASKRVADVLGITTRMVAHYVSVTGQEASAKPDGRGTRRQFTYKESGLLAVGRKLSGTGMSPVRVKQCLDAVLRIWDKMFPDAMILVGEPEEYMISHVEWKPRDYHLLAWEDKKGEFHCETVSWEHFSTRLINLATEALVLVYLTPLIRSIMFELAADEANISK